jgi:hypothetical protein
LVGNSHAIRDPALRAPKVVVMDMLDGLGGVAAIISASTYGACLLTREVRKTVDWRDKRKRRRITTQATRSDCGHSP